MSGSGFPAATSSVKVYWEASGPGLPLTEAPATPSGVSDEKAFSTGITIPAAADPGAHLLVPVPFDSAGNVVGSSIGPAPAAVYQVTDPSLTLTPAAGPPGSTVRVDGAAFRSGTVKVHWGSPTGPELGSATATGAGFTFAREVAVPNGPPGPGRIFAVPAGDPADSASASFTVTAPVTLVPALTPPLPRLVDRAGPTISAATLRRGNRTLLVSRRGNVRVFCGRFSESGVTGFCGARSVRRLAASGAARRSAVVKLRRSRFRARAGRPVRVRFHLSKRAMRTLRRAKKVRMRGTVNARDATGNATRKSFRFTLRAPKARRTRTGRR